MCNTFNSIFNRMSIVVHRVNYPFITCIVMFSFYNTINNRVTHNDIRMCHVNFCTQHLFTIIVLTVFHFFEEFQVFFYATITVRAIDTRCREITTSLFDFLCSLVIYIGFAKRNQFLSIFVHFTEVVGCIANLAIPFKAEPFYIFHDGVYVFNIFFCWVCIIKTKIC